MEGRRRLNDLIDADKLLAVLGPRFEFLPDSRWNYDELWYHASLFSCRLPLDHGPSTEQPRRKK